MRKQKNSQKHVFFLAVIFTALLPTTSLADMSGGTFNARNEVVVPLVGQMDGSGYHANISIVPVAGVVTGTGFSVSVGYPVVATPSSSSSSSGGGGFVPPAAPTPTPTPTPTPEPEEEKPKVHNIYNVQTRFVGPGSASITFDTDAPAKTFMSYMGGGQANNTTPESVGVFAHTITLSGLKSSTTYTFTISAEFSDGQKIVFQNNTYTFTTSSAPEDPKEVKTVKDKELTPTDKPSQPSNPSNPGTDSGTTPTGPQSTLPDPSNVMYTYSETDNPVLSWKKPDDPRVSQIVIARSTVNFPQKPSEGEIVYSGTVEAFTDASALGSQEYYYTVFSIDSSGNSSLGVPIKTTPKEKEIKKEEVPLEQTSEESAEPTLKEFIEETLPAAETSSKVVGVVGAAGYAAAAASNMFALSAASGLAEMKLMILRLWSDFLSLIYLRRRRRVWGIVYDSETKQPLDPVVLELKNPETGAVIETAVTDLAGRYGFLAKTGRYVISAKKNNYVFPSQKLTGSSDLVYDSLYHGETFELKPEFDVVSPNIPMDPLKSDFNQEWKAGAMKFHPKRNFWVKKLASLFYFVGLAGALYSLYHAQSLLNWLTLILYVIIFVVPYFLFKGRLWGRILGADKQGKGGILLEIAYASIPTIAVSRAVTRENGMFFLKVPRKDSYILTVKDYKSGQMLKQFPPAFQQDPLNSDIII